MRFRNLEFYFNENPSEMLQKGFLKPREKEENSRAAKRSRTFFIAGVFLILSGFLVLMTRMQQGQEKTSITYMILFFFGFFLLSVSLWMNFITQNKKRKH